MCMFNFWDQMTGCARVAFSIALCCLCVGPVLIVVGIVLLTWPNTRDADIAAYNSQGATYTGGDYLVWPRVSANVTGSGYSSPRTMTLRNQSVDVVGNKDGVQDFFHYSLTTPSLSRSISDTYSIELNVAANATQNTASSSLSVDIPYFGILSFTMTCTRSQCPKCTHKSSVHCSRADMRSYCTRYYAGNYSSSSSSDCDYGESCGTCTYVGSLSEACIVVTFGANNVITRSSKYTSCYYPFSTFKYARVPFSRTLSIISDQDPFLTLQQRTSGSMDFGSYGVQRKAAGIAMLVIGVLASVAAGAVTVFMVRRHNDSTVRRPRTPPPPPRTPPPPPVYPEQAELQPMEAQPVYGQPVAQCPHCNRTYNEGAYDGARQRPLYGYPPTYTQQPIYGQQPPYGELPAYCQRYPDDHPQQAACNSAAA